ncbi:MAG: helix-turn-helix domain-containing protein [Planctomycetota bacterium]|jgi:AraC-like DNA-binding protein
MPDGQDTQAIPPPFRVRTAGHIATKPHHSTPGSKQGDVMLTVFLAGRGFYFLDRGRSVVETGTVGLVEDRNPGILLADPADPYDHYYCRFSGDYARAMAARIVRARGGRFFHHERHEEVADLIRRMGHVHRALLPERLGLPELLLAEALVVISEPPSQPAPRLTTHSLRHYLLEHVSEPFELARAAEHFGMSRASLCRAARRITGRTVLDTAEELKVDWARTLLASGALNVTGLSPRAWLDSQPPRHQEHQEAPS